eukprot:5879596-Prorocentrum_lima.AAC.1
MGNTPSEHRTRTPPNATHQIRHIKPRHTHLQNTCHTSTIANSSRPHLASSAGWLPPRQARPPQLRR